MAPKVRRGFTFSEVLVVFFISVLLAGALFRMLSSGRGSLSRVDAQVILQEELRRGMRQIVRDLRQTGISRISLPDNGNNYTAISFNVAEGVLGSGAVKWSADAIAYNLSGGQILRTHGADARVVANKVGSMNFRRSPQSHVVQIYLRCQTTTSSNQLYSAALNSSVVLRND